MPTAINASANANAQKKQQPKMIAKWSGSSSPQSYYSREDDDGITLRTATKWYDVKYPEYDDGDDCHSEHDDVSPIAPHASAAPPPRISSLFWTTPLSIASGEEPMFEPEYPDHEESIANFTFGVCCDCGVGLCDKSEFICCHTGANGHVNACNACHNYHMNLHIGGEDGGCN
jgi:hypothetical protein